MDRVILANLLLDLWGAVHKIMAPELKGRVLDQLYEGDQQTPWVRPVHNQPLQQDPARQALQLTSFIRLYCYLQEFLVTL